MTDSPLFAAKPVQRLVSDLDSLVSELDPLYPESDWLDGLYHDAKTAEDTRTLPGNASKNQSSLLPAAFVERWLELSRSLSCQDNTHSVLELGDLQYPTCSICPSVAPLVTTNALCHLHRLTGYLPTRILPSKRDSPLPSYLAELPVGAIYSTVRVLVSRPEQHHLSATSQKSSHELVQSKFVNVKAHVENTVQFIRIGLTGDQDSQKSLLHQIREAQVHQVDDQGSPRESLDDKCTEKGEENRLRKASTISKRKANLISQSDHTSQPLAHGTHSISSTPSSAQRCSLDHEQLQEVRSPVNGTKSKDGHSSSAFNDNKHCSENVQLSFDHAGSSSEFQLIFKPSLLLKRFQAWTETRKGHGTLLIDRGFSADHDDPPLLNELAEVLSSSELDLTAYKHLCSRHRPRLLSRSMNEPSISILGNENADPTDMPESNHSSKRGERDLLDEYCTLDESSQEMISQSEQEQDISMRLPRILSWFVSSIDVTSADTTGQESRACCPGNVLDFVLEDGTMDCETASGPATVRGALRDVWTKLTKQQLQQLMLTLVRLLVDVWKNFDILDRSVFEYPLELSKEPCLQHCGVGQHASPMEQSLPISDYGQTSSPRKLEGSAERTSAKMSAAERLVYLEEEFLNRSFLDAFNQATASSPSDNRQLIDSMISVFDENLPAVPPESPPPKRRRVNTDQNEYSHRSANDSRGTCEEGMAWTLGSSQRVTTTRTQALEFMASQKSGSAVTPIDGDGSPGAGMRQFDFSLDDLLVTAPNETYSQDGDGQLCPSAFSKCEIIGVSRWKAGGGTGALNTQTEELTPRGNNVYQVRARGSTYPLVHLFSLPDIFCPVELGGQCVVKQLDTGGLAGEFVRLLGCHSLAAGEFMTDTLPDKERTLYHRWMAAWHERSPLAPKATKIRFELMRMVRNHHCAGVDMNDQWEPLDTTHTLNNGDDNNNEEEGVGVELKMAAPRAYRGLRPIQQGHSHAQQPSGGGVSSSAPANLKARCDRCMDEEHEQEMISEDKAWFDSTAQFLDEVQAEEKRRREQQKMRRLSAARRDQSFNQLGRQLGLGKQWMRQGRALGLQLDAVGVASMDGAGAVTGSEAIDDASDSLGERSKPSWILSAEEREIMRMHLFGQGDQTAASAADTEAG